MAKNVPDNISRQDVLDAIAAFSTGSVQHGFHESEKYDLIYEGLRFPPKAILGIAAQRSAGRILEPSEFSGGEGSACFRILRNLGFLIELKPEFQGGADWSDGEIDAAVEAYLAMLRLEIEGGPLNKAEVNRKLREGALVNRTKSSVEYRMQNISSVLKGLGRRHISGYRPASNVGANVERKIVASLERLDALTAFDSSPEADPEVLENRVRRNRMVPLLTKPEGSNAPRRVSRSSDQFERNPRVKAWVLDNAQGKCEFCGSDAPFKDDYGFPFLEVHHIVPLANDGRDEVDNAVALCPNCHRRCHHGQDRKVIAERLRETAAKRL